MFSILAPTPTNQIGHPSKLEVAHRRDLHLADDLELRVAVLDLELHVEHADKVLETVQ